MAKQMLVFISSVILLISSNYLVADNFINIDKSPTKRPANNNVIKHKPPQAQPYECKNYICTCKIGPDCGEMFSTIKIENCDYGGPGELKCQSAPKE